MIVSDHPLSSPIPEKICTSLHQEELGISKLQLLLVQFVEKHPSHQVQWGSEYRTSLVFKWSKVVRWSNGLTFKWWSEYRTILVHYLNDDLNIGQFVQYFLSCKVNGTGHLNNRWSEYWTFKGLLFRCFRYSDVHYSDTHCNFIVTTADTETSGSQMNRAIE